MPVLLGHSCLSYKRLRITNEMSSLGGASFTKKSISPSSDFPISSGERPLSEGSRLSNRSDPKNSPIHCWLR